MTRNLALSAWRFWVCWALDAQCNGLDAQERRNGGKRVSGVPPAPLAHTPLAPTPPPSPTRVESRVLERFELLAQPTDLLKSVMPGVQVRRCPLLRRQHGLKVGGRGWDPRVHADSQFLRLRNPVHREANSILARNCNRPERTGRGVVRNG